MGATLVSEAIAATIRPNEHGTTFGGGPVAAAAALEVLTILEEDHLAERAEVLGERLRAELRAIPGVREVRGQGLLIGVALDRPAGPLVSKGWTQGLIVGGSGLPDTLRVIPPLNVTDADVEEFLVRFRELLA
jgi:acetylornithine/N-succinyldiaminopimelate aminotransferase